MEHRGKRQAAANLPSCSISRLLPTVDLMNWACKLHDMFCFYFSCTIIILYYIVLYCITLYYIILYYIFFKVYIEYII